MSEYYTIQILNDILTGLLKLHQNKICHGNIKPANVMISDGVFKLSDYRMLKIVQANPCT